MLTLATTLAYIGPGAGLGAIAVVIALAVGVGLLLIGLVWYPLKRTMRSRSDGHADAAVGRRDQPG